MISITAGWSDAGAAFREAAASIIVGCMKTPRFSADGFDRSTFAPFELQDCRTTEWADVRLTFDAWDALHALAGGESLDDYYLNGYGVEGLVKGAMVDAGIDLDDERIHENSEGGACNLHFTDLDLAIRAAEAAAAMMTSVEHLRAAVTRARAHGFED
jgi:hypothetical protein